MKLLHLFALTIALTPSIASAALFPSNTLVKMIDEKGFKKAMKQNATSVVAFVAPWCGHCQKMGPEYSRAALGLYPMIPLYAVDCDKQSNKRLCAEQGVQGFPTVKLFPRGADSEPILFDGPQRSASAFYYFAIRNIPHGVKKLYHLEDVPGWLEGNTDMPRALLLNQGKHIPLLWQTLGNKYKDQIKFSIHRDRRGKSSLKMGLEQGEPKSSKVLFYPPGSMDFVRFEGIQKFDSLSKFFDSVLDGTADLSTISKQAAEEEFIPDEKELEIEREQEAQRIALAHGGFTELIDFEEAIKKGHGADYHDVHGYPGMMGAPPKKDAGDAKAKEEEDPIRRILKAQQEAEKKEREKPKMAKTGDAGQVVLEAVETGHPKTPVAEPPITAVAGSATPDAIPDEEKRDEEKPEVTPETLVVDAEESTSVPEPFETRPAVPAAGDRVDASDAAEGSGHTKDEL